jgi:hypothetical protein
METSTLLASIAAALITFVIATVAIGRESHRLDGIAPRAVYRLDEAVDFVCDRLPQSSQARLTPAEVERLLIAHMGWLHERGLQPDRVVDRAQDIDETVLVDETTLIAHLLVVAADDGVELLDDVDAVEVVSAHLAYFDAIGAVGPIAAPDDVIGE